MSLKKLLLPAAVLIAVMSFLASHAQAQTMGEYATTTAGVGTGSGSMGTSFAPPSFGESSQTWGVSGTGSSWADRAGAASGFGSGSDFASRAASMSAGAAAESRWPETGISAAQGTAMSSRFNDSSDRFSSSNQDSSKDRFPSRSFSADGRWPTSSFSDNKGLDTSYNSISGN